MYYVPLSPRPPHPSEVRIRSLAPHVCSELEAASPKTPELKVCRFAATHRVTLALPDTAGGRLFPWFYMLTSAQHMQARLGALRIEPLYASLGRLMATLTNHTGKQTRCIRIWVGARMAWGQDSLIQQLPHISNRCACRLLAKSILKLEASQLLISLSMIGDANWNTEREDRPFQDRKRPPHLVLTLAPTTRPEDTGPAGPYVVTRSVSGSFGKTTATPTNKV